MNCDWTAAVGVILRVARRIAERGLIPPDFVCGDIDCHSSVTSSTLICEVVTTGCGGQYKGIAIRHAVFSKRQRLNDDRAFISR